MEARVGIQYEDSNFLFKINKSKSLPENIDAICEQIRLEPSESYGLKFNYTGNTNGANSENYVTEENFGKIQNGYTLKLVQSLDLVIDRIFGKMHEDRHRCFNELYNLSTDPGFIRAIVRKERHIDVLQWLNDKYLSGKELSTCLITLLHLLKKRFIDELAPTIVENIIRSIKITSPPTPPAQLQYLLAVLCQILYLKGHDVNKQLIIAEISISDLTPFIWSQEHSNLQLNTLMLINAMVKCVRGEKRAQFVKELNRRKCKEYVFINIIQSSKLSDAMAHELYVYQTYVLSTYAGALNTYIDTKTNSNLKDLDQTEDNVSRCSAFMDFEYSRSRSNSATTILEETEDTRISFASIESETSINSELSARDSNPFLDEQICQLTNDCLVHYKKYHHKNFCQSRIEENTYRPGISITSERVVRMIAKLLQIGKEPTKTGQLYHPLIFNGSLALPFLMELFSRTMWLLSKTRREMKAYGVEDYLNLLLVVEKQINMVLEEKPMDYNALTTKMMKITYEQVDQLREKEKAAEWKMLYEKNPSVQVLKQKFQPENEKLIFQQRVSLLQQGCSFPKLPEKKNKPQMFFMKLSDNKRMIIWGEGLDTSDSLYTEQFLVADIKHLIVGKACPHVKDHSVKTPEKAFTVILEDGLVINFLAPDQKTANIWIDGLSLLLGKAHRSEDYRKELEALMEMDCALHLLELQNISIPNSLPEMPPLPPQLRSRPALPPKSPKFTKRKSLATYYNNTSTNIYDIL